MTLPRDLSCCFSGGFTKFALVPFSRNATCPLEMTLPALPLFATVILSLWAVAAAHDTASLLPPRGGCVAYGGVVRRKKIPPELKERIKAAHAAVRSVPPASGLKKKIRKIESGPTSLDDPRKVKIPDALD